MKNNKLILIVDDEFSMRKNIVDILTNEGFRTIEAGDGLEAIAKVNESKPDVVLLDINMRFLVIKINYINKLAYLLN